MDCKFCGAQMEEGQTLCPVCGQENEPAITEPETLVAEEAVPAQQEPETDECECEDLCETDADEEPELPARKAKPAVWKIVLTAVCAVVLAAALTLGVMYGMGISLLPKEKDALSRDTYTVDVQKAQEDADKVIATVGDQKLTNAEFQVYYWNQVYQFATNFGYQYFDVSKPLSEQVFSEETGMTWEQYFVGIALSTWQRYQTLSILAGEEGFKLNDEQIEYLANIPQSLQEMAAAYGYSTALELVQADMGKGCTVEGYVKYMADYYTGLEYFNYKYSQLEPTMEDIEAYYTANEETFKEKDVTKDSGNQVDVRHILVMVEGGTQDESGNTVYSDAEWQACQAEAQKIYDEWKSGAATEESFAELANKYSEDGGSNTNGGLYQGITPATNFVENFLNWCMDPQRQIGDTGLVQTEHGYHIMYLSASEPLWVSTARTMVISDRASAMIDDGMERYPMKVNYKKIVLADTLEETVTDTTGTDTAPQADATEADTTSQTDTAATTEAAAPTNG